MTQFKKQQALFKIYSKENIILLSGSKVQPLKASARDSIKALRLATTSEQNGVILTTQDISFKSVSTASAFVLGSNCNGLKYFNGVDFDNLKDGEIINADNLPIINNNKIIKATETTSENVIAHESGHEIIKENEQQEQSEKAIEILSDDKNAIASSSQNVVSDEEIEKAREQLQNEINARADADIKSLNQAKSNNQIERFTSDENAKLNELLEKLENLILGFDYVAQDGTPLLNVRTLSNYLHAKDYKAAAAVLCDFAYISGQPKEIIDEMKNYYTNKEAQQLFNDFKSLNLEKHGLLNVNNKLVIYYGGGGTGKTTDARKEYPNAKKISAYASKDSETLLCQFDMQKKRFVLSDIANAMINGETLIIDEFIEYNDEVLERFKSLTDNDTFVYDEITHINIYCSPNFKIIATFNKKENRALSGALASRAIIKNYGERPTLATMKKWLFK